MRALPMVVHVYVYVYYAIVYVVVRHVHDQTVSSCTVVDTSVEHAVDNSNILATVSMDWWSCQCLSWTSLHCVILYCAVLYCVVLYGGLTSSLSHTICT